MEAPLQLLGEQHLHHLQDMQRQQLSERLYGIYLVQSGVQLLAAVLRKFERAAMAYTISQFPYPSMHLAPSAAVDY